MDAAGNQQTVAATVPAESTAEVVGLPAAADVAGGQVSVSASVPAVGETALLQTATVTADAAAEPEAAATEAVVPEPLPEPYTSLLKQAKESPTEFNTWTSLISAAEKLADVGRLRTVYDAFLAEYPLCYGYWKKYADAEAKYTSQEEASRIYDRGVAAVPYSVDLWGHYAMHKQKAGAPVEEVERLFERGLAYVGMDYLSHGLWDKYLTYELSLGAHAQVAQLYSRLLRMPIQRLDEYRTRFYDYAAQHTAAEMLAEEERAVLATQLAQELKEAQAAEAAAAEAAAAQSAAHAATAAASAANTDVAQAMDTTAGSDDAFDAVAQDTVNAARSMTGDIAAPAAVTAADSTAADDAPVADAPPDAPSIAVPAPDDIAATLMAASTATTSDAAIPTAAALDSTPAAVTASFPASAPPAAAGLLPPQDAAAVPPHLAAPTVIPPTADTEMQEAVIPQTDGPADDPMETLESEAAPMDTTMASPEAAAAVIIATEAAVLPSQVAVPSAVLAPPIAIAPSQAPADGPADGAVADTSDAAAGVQPTHGLAEALADSAVSTAAGAGAAAPGTAESQAPSTQTPESSITDDQVKAAWLRSVEESYVVAKEEWQRRKPFEDGVKRPYFHVKPLDLAQLQNWSKYLDYIEEKKDIGMIIRLYERCLVACASYPDLWMRYVRWQEGSSKAAAQVALERATSVHCKRRPEMQLFAAHFHERHANLKTARALFKLVTERLAPTLLQATVQFANFERRQRSKAAACAAFDKFLDREAAKADSNNYVFMVLQYMHALQWGFSDLAKAREVYNAALKKKGNSLTLWEGVTHFEENLPGTDRLTRVLDIYERAVAPAATPTELKPDAAATGAATAATDGPSAAPAAGGTAAEADSAQASTAAAAAEPAATDSAPQTLSESEREALSLQGIDFVDMQGDAALLAKVEQQHAHRFKLPGKVVTSSAASKKRSADAMAGSASKAAKTAAAATPAGEYPTASLPGPPVAGATAAAAASQGYYGAQSYYQYPQYATAQQPYSYPAASAAGASAYAYQAYY